MFDALARLAVQRARLVLIVAGVGVLLSAFAGIHAFGALKSAGFVSPNAPSQIAANKLTDDFAGAPDFILLVTARAGTVDSPAVATAGRAVVARLAAEPGVREVESYWTTGGASFVSRSRTQGLVLASVNGSTTYVANRIKTLTPQFHGDTGAVSVQVGGAVYVGNSIGKQITGDLGKAEGIAIPLTLLLLILVFGSAVSAFLPVLIGTVSIFTTLAVLWLLSLVTDVSQYALNLTTAMSLGLAIDYSLLMVNRYREEIAAGHAPTDALIRAINRAGRTIVFSAATVAAAMAALLVFPMYFLRSFAYAGISVVVLATVGALVVLPAMLALLGARVDAWKVPVGRRMAIRGGESPFWRRIASGVMRRPVLAALPVVVVLAAMIVPFTRVNFGTPDDRVLAPGSPYRAVGDALRSQFVSNVSTTTDILTSRPLSAADVAAYSRTISELPGVTVVNGPDGSWAHGIRTPVGPGGLSRFDQYRSPASTWLSAVTPDPLSRQAQSLVKTIRAIPVPGGAASYVGGQAAGLVDQKADLADGLPLALALIGITTLLVLWLFTGSLVLPLKALALNALTITSVLGAMVWIFQFGHLSGLLGFTPSPTSTTMPLLVFCIAFGLSMDYEVFVLSRIKELHDAGQPNQEAVVGGVARTGRIVTTAAALMAITFFAFATSQVSFIQMFALGTGLAILIDAFLVRGVLVPAFMRLAGRWNWWSPAPLRRLHDRVGISETPPAAPAVAEGARV